MSTHLLEHSRFISFLTAGNSVFTILRTGTEERFTYKVLRSDGDEPTFWVNLLSGPDNMSNYTGMAFIKKDNDGMPLLKKFAKFTNKIASFTLLEEVFYVCLTAKENDPDYEIWHEGRCCVCGRRLTVPESIESGIGPECATKSLSKYF